ncbi:hypothetical protein DAPPUDRAFT_263668 [Daphnia pulex]|uniref:Uncharacterized protein n=1 Tax=Daphnia pulex TaxID=6669 RepID=E9HQ70_DAPPU|nr:hypothetical protein DAPPUDRAFT_263668 [Daphnia pulex]|eukprot:EFX66121.1 hypothetical protein DAPPUDRAFT_263668 [Daphnia pulex]
MSSKRKRKDELAARKAKSRATESEVQRFARLEANAVRNAAARSAESEHQTVNRRAEDDLNAEFKVCRKRVEAVGRFLIQNHPGFASHRITFSQTNCDLLPEDGLF